jgi:vitamin B12 transporter
MTSLTMMMNSTASIAALAAIALTAPALAAEASAQADTVPRYEIADVLVTVARDSTRAAELPRSIQVIGPREIRSTAADDAAQLLKKTAALDVIEFPGLLAGVGMRGFRPQFSGITHRTLVLIDGRPAGASNLALIDARMLDRVEVLRGPGSSLYGSSAMGGVVNLVSRRSSGPIRSTATLGYGSWETAQASLRAGGDLGARSDFDLSVSGWERGADYRAGRGGWFRDRLGDTVAVRIFADSTSLSRELGDGETLEHSRFGTRSGSLRLGHALSDAWRADLRLEAFAADRVRNPGDLHYAWGDNRTLKDVARGSGDLALEGAIGRHLLRARAFVARDHADNFDAAEPDPGDPLFVGLETRNRWHGAQLQDAMRLGVHTLVVGMDWTEARANSSRFGGPDERLAPWEPDSRIGSAALFGEARVRLADDRLVGTLGARLDRISFRVDATELWDGGLSAANDERFNAFNPSAGLQYTLDSGVRLHGSAGRAFVTPTAFQVAGQVVRRGEDGLHLTLGNSALAPESSVTWDAGIGWLRPGSGLDLDLTWFSTRVSDRIATERTEPAGQTGPDGTPVASRTTYVNANRATLAGIEARAAYDLGAHRGSYLLRPFVTATRMTRATETLGALEREVRNVADLTMAFGADWDDLRRLSMRLSGRYVGERIDDDWNVWPSAEVRYPASLTLDWTGEARLADRFRLGLVVSNLTDENVYEVRGYPLPGRAAQLRLSVDF